MAAPPTTEASEIRRRGRQRLIGAIALVAILVVFVPMVLDSGPRPPRNEPDLSIPSKTDAPPLPAPPKAAPAKAAEARPAAPAPAEAAKPAEPTKPVESPKVATVESAPAKPLDARVLESKPPPPPKAAPVAPAPDKGARGQAPSGAQAPPASPVAPAKAGAQSPAPRLEGFAVQVGAFRDEAKLEQARQKVFAAKIPHYTERLEAQGGPLTRLRAGPFASREAAEAALATLKRSAVDGKVVPLP
jgi:DedD protein